MVVDTVAAYYVAETAIEAGSAAEKAEQGSIQNMQSSRTYTVVPITVETLGPIIHSFIHSGHFYSAPSIPYYSEALPTTARILYRSFTPKRTSNCS